MTYPFQARIYSFFILILSWRPAVDRDRLFFIRLNLDLLPGFDPGVVALHFNAERAAPKGGKNSGLAGSAVSPFVQRASQFDLPSVHSGDVIDADSEFAASAEALLNLLQTGGSREMNTQLRRHVQC